MYQYDNWREVEYDRALAEDERKLDYANSYLVECRCGNQPEINSKGQVYCEDCELTLGKKTHLFNFEEIGIAVDRWNMLMSDKKIKTIFDEEQERENEFMARDRQKIKRLR